MTDLTLKDRMIPWYFVMFFAVVALVDGVMVTLAVRTNSGLVTDHAYERGLAYNEVVDAKARQDALGWNDSVSWDGKILHVVVTDGKGAVIVPDKITAYFSRPTRSGMDFETDIMPAGSPVAFPASGIWDARINVLYRENVYQLSRRLMIK